MAAPLPTIVPRGAAITTPAALDAMFRGLFDRHDAQAHLARLAAMCGADAVVFARRPRRSAVVIVGAWTTPAAAGVPGSVATQASLWARTSSRLRQLAALTIADRPALRLLFDTKSADPAMLVLTRRPEDGCFSAHAVAQLAALAPHAARAIALRGRLDRAIHGARAHAAVLDGVPLALAIVDSDGHVLVANAAARAIIEGHGGLRVERRRMVIVGPAASALDAAIAAATMAEPERRRPATVALSPAGGSTALRLHFLPLESSTLRRLPADTEASLALLCFESSAGPPAISDAAARYDLTAAERRILACVLAGAKPASIARSLDVSVFTVRAHLRSIYDKTGCRGVPALTARFIAG